MSLSEQGITFLEQEPNESACLLADYGHNANEGNHEQSTKTWYRTSSVYWILPVIFIYTIIDGSITVPQIKFYLQVSCQHYYDSKKQHPIIDIQDFSDGMCNIPEVQAITSQLIMALILCQTITGILVAGYYGSLSDRKGRCPVLLIANVGMVFNSLNIILVGNFHEYFGIKFLVIFTLFSGFFGGNSSLSFIVQAYATDCTLRTRRNIIFGWIQAASFLGHSIGLVTGGWIVKATNSLLSVYYISFVTCILIFLFILFILPESLTSDKLIANQRRQAQSSRITTIMKKINFLSPLKIYFPKNSDSVDDLPGDKIPLKAKKYSLLLLAGINCVQSVALVGYSLLSILYITYKFKWTAIEQGYLVSMNYVLKVVVLLAVLPALHKIFKKDNIDEGKRDDGHSYANNDEIPPSREAVTEERDEIQMKTEELLFNVWIIVIGSAIGATAFFIYGFAENGLVFIIGTCIRSLNMIVNPTIISLQANLVRPSQVGQLLCANNILETTSYIISPLIFNTLYSTLILSNALNLIWFGIASILTINSIVALGIQ